MGPASEPQHSSAETSSQIAHCEATQDLPTCSPSESELLRAVSVDAAPAMYELVRNRTSDSDPQSPIADEGVGLPSRLKRQASVPEGTKKTCPTAKLRLGRAGLKDGTYLFVVMVATPDEIRLVHEEHLRAGDWKAGHTSLVTRSEFSRNWAALWKASDPAAFRQTVLFAGELEYREGEGVLSW